MTKTYRESRGRASLYRISPGESIGTHKHDTSEVVVYTISGKGIAICDDIIEPLTPGVCHVCKAGSVHSIENGGRGDLVLLVTVFYR